MTIQLKIERNDLTLGCDPEFFLYSTKHEHFVSAAGLFPGTKEEPHPLEGGAVQVDGLALEFNIDPIPCAECTSHKHFSDKIDSVLRQVKDMIGQVDKNLVPRFVPFARFPEKYFEELDDDQKILGCSPDYNVRGKKNRVPKRMMHSPFRTAAGHIHIGYTEAESLDRGPHADDCRFIAKSFHDAAFFAPQTAEAMERLKYYGGEGAYRPKPYGVELREPDNTWVDIEAERKRIALLVIGFMTSILTTQK